MSPDGGKSTEHTNRQLVSLAQPKALDLPIDFHIKLHDGFFEMLPKRQSLSHEITIFL
jgi:hypothetical protein